MAKKASESESEGTAEPSAPRKSATVAYQVLRHIQIDGADYRPEPDKVVTIEIADEAVAQTLLAAGAIQGLPPAT